MSNEDWKRGYKETKNLVHNEIGLTKEELKEVFEKIAREEIQQIVKDNKAFIFDSIKEVIQGAMVSAVSEHRYPKVNGHMLIYGNQGKGDNSFKDFVSGVMKEEIVQQMEQQFTVSVNVSENKKTD